MTSTKLNIVIAILLMSICSGCNQPEPVTTAESKIPKPISVTFVGIDGVADNVARQWSATFSGQIECETISLGEFQADNRSSLAESDVVIYPPRLMGSLIADELITPLPDEVWNSESFDNRGLLRNSRLALIRFDNQRWAVPLGSPNLFLLLRTDAIDAVGKGVPKSWTELVDFVDALRTMKQLAATNTSDAPPTRFAVPTDGNRMADIFLAISAASVRHRGKLNFLFDRNDMTPLLDTPPFVEAVTILQSFVKSDQPISAAECMQSYLNGELAGVIGWPSRSFVNSMNDEVSGVGENTVLLRLPGSTRWYDFSNAEWVENEDSTVQQVDLIGFDGVQASILKSAKYPTTAFQFVSWLASKEVTTEIMSTSRQSGPSRPSHLGDPTSWMGEGFGFENADRFAEITTEINESPLYLMFPRIRGATEYLDCLSLELRVFLEEVDDGDPSAILKSVAEEWQTITEKHGRQKQLRLLRQDD